MKKRSGFALLLVVPALALAACGGGGNSDKDKITNLIKDVDNNPANLCDHATTEVLKPVGGVAGCKKAAKKAPKQRDVKVNSVKVNGNTATATVTAKVNGKTEGNQKIGFVKQGGDWKIANSG